MRHVYADSREKRLDFWRGFVGWVVINVIAIGVLGFLLNLAGPVPGTLTLLNIGAPIVLGFTRPYAALGVLMAFGSALALTVTLAIFETPADFTAGRAGPIVFIPFGALGLAAYGVGAFFVLRKIHRSL